MPATSKTPPPRVGAESARPAAPSAPALALRTILCPVDLSEGSARALDQAVALARAAGGEITAMFVFPLPPKGRRDLEGEPGLRDTVAQDLSRLLTTARAAGVPAWISLKDGDAAAAIVTEAKAIRADVVVMGTHGRSPVSRWVLGSVAAEVLRRAPCPVVTVSPSAAGMGGGGVLCALDLAAGGEGTLARALAVAQALRAPLTVVHVVESAGRAAVPAAMRAAARVRLRALVTAQGPPGTEVEEVVLRGQPAREIVRLARARKPGLIVIGRRRSAAVGRFLLGSTADELVRRAPAAVLSVRHRARRD